MAQATPAFPGRNVYASSSKLPDRTALKPGSAAAQQYTQSSLGRRPDQPYQFGQSTATQQHGGLGARSSMEKEPNALSELSEEQRDEINEAVMRASPLLFYHMADANQKTVFLVRPRSRSSSRLPRTSGCLAILGIYHP